MWPFQLFYARRAFHLGLKKAYLHRNQTLGRLGLRLQSLVESPAERSLRFCRSRCRKFGSLIRGMFCYFHNKCLG